MTGLLLCLPKISALQNHSARNQVETFCLWRKQGIRGDDKLSASEGFLPYLSELNSLVQIKSHLGRLPFTEIELSNTYDFFFLLPTPKCASLLQVDLYPFVFVHENVAL